MSMCRIASKYETCYATGTMAVKTENWCWKGNRADAIMAGARLRSSGDGAANTSCCGVIGTRCLLRHVEGFEPNPISYIYIPIVLPLYGHFVGSG